jgi:hypothetical protein
MNIWGRIFQLTLTNKLCASVSAKMYFAVFLVDQHVDVNKKRVGIAVNHNRNIEKAPPVTAGLVYF